jgi:tetratricopeptide (TPR) repeat protein
MGDRSVSARDIKQSIVITGRGNSARLVFGDSGIVLPLRRKQFPPPDRHRPRAGEPPRELDLLVAETGKLPLVGRQDLIADLQTWLDDGADISVYGLIGRAGAGKTRLAIEFCRITDGDPNGKGPWIAGFLSPSDLDDINKAFATRSYDWERNTLLVIDYAAQCHEALARWLDRLAERKLGTKLRILLLDREAPDYFGWWHTLTVLGAPSRRDLFRELRPRHLPDLSDTEERRALMTAALQAARELHPGTSGIAQIPSKDANPDFDRRLGEHQFGNPLNLVMAGLIALDRGPQAALALRRLDAARYIARRELRRLSDLARSRQIGEDEIRHIFAFNGLAGGLPIAGLRKTIADELAISHRSAERLSEIAELLEQEFPVRSESTQQSRLATIQPDLIGEAVVIEAFTGGPSREDEAAETVQRAYGLTGEAAAQVLIRLVQDFAYAVEDPGATEEERTTGGRVTAWLLKLTERIDDPDQMLPLAFALPRRTTILRAPAAALIERLALHFHEKAEHDNDPVEWAIAAGLIDNLALRLSALGRREEALEAAKKAVRLRRAFLGNGLDAFMPDLASSLDNQSRRLGEFGRLEEALASAEEAVSLRRALATGDPGAFKPGLASSIGNLSSRLSALGRREEALATGEEAVCLYRSLADDRPEAFVSELATSLNNLANRLSAAGHRDEAVSAADEAVRLHRAVSEVNPDAFTPDLANSLHNLAYLQSNLGRHEQAESNAKEALALRQTLARTHPDVFRPDLASSVSNLAVVLVRSGRRSEALTAAEEAVLRYRSLAEAQPEVFSADLARALTNLGNILGELRRSDEALPKAEEAVRLYRTLAVARPDAFTPQLAAALNNLANRLNNLERHAEALAFGEEAVRQFRALAEVRPRTFTPDLAGSLIAVANGLSAVGRIEEGLTAAAEAVQLRRAVADASPGTSGGEYAQALSMLGDQYVRSGRPELAVATMTEAIRQLTPSFTVAPEAVSGTMAHLVAGYTEQCGALDREPDRALLNPVFAVFERLKRKEENR